MRGGNGQCCHLPAVVQHERLQRRALQQQLGDLGVGDGAVDGQVPAVRGEGEEKKKKGEKKSKSHLKKSPVQKNQT